MLISNTRGHLQAGMAVLFLSGHCAHAAEQVMAGERYVVVR